MNNNHPPLIKDKKDFFTRIAVLFGVSFIIITTLMFLHFPPIYYTGTTLSAIPYFLEQNRPEELITLGFLMIFWSIIFMPLLLAFKGKIFGKILLFLFAVMTGIEKYVFYINGQNAPWNSAFNRNTLETFMSETNIGGIRDAYITYSSNDMFFLYLLVFPLGIFIAISLLLKLIKPINHWWVSIAGASIFLAGLSTIQLETDAPYMYKVPLVIENYVVENTINRILGIERKEIFFNKVDTNKTRPDNIVFIMDESIRGDLISINNPTEKAVMETTPYLYSIKDKLINFGDSYSLGNCSQISNMLFMGGLDDKALKTRPMIFQYMKNAGYTTYLIDSPHDRLLDGFYYYDKPFIDNYITVRHNEKMDRDIKGLEEVQAILNKPGKNFIFIIKQGSHFPFEENFKKEDAPLEYDNKTPKGFFNLYMNSLTMTVDNYWRKLIKVVGNSDTLVFWQSDHGVNIAPDKGNTHVKLTHCEIGMTYAEELYSVPSVLYSPNKEYYKGYKNLNGGYSTIHMLPTILSFAGYNEKDIEEHYSTTYKNPNPEVIFFTETNIGDNPIIKNNLINKKEIGKYQDKEVEKNPLNIRRKHHIVNE